MEMIYPYLNFLEPSGHARPVMGLLYIYLNFLNPLGHARPVMGLLYLYRNFLEHSWPPLDCKGNVIPLLLLHGTLWATPGL